MGLRPLEIFSFFQCGDRLYTSEFDVYRRQILTYKDGPSAERVEPYRTYFILCQASDIGLTATTTYETSM